MRYKMDLTRTLILLIPIIYYSNAAYAKGLESLQADTETPADQVTPPTSPAAEAPPPANPTQPAVQSQTPSSPPQNQVVPTPNFAAEKFYMASSLSWLNLASNKGGWHTNLTGDIQAGYRILSLMQKIDIFGTYRYRPVDVLVHSEQRQYRGIVETHLLGGQAKLALNNRLITLASLEIGASKTHLNAIDSLAQIDQDLEKSGVDLSLGAEVSYLVLDRLGIGTKFALGTGAFRTIQLGVNLRFLL